VLGRYPRRAAAAAAVVVVAVAMIIGDPEGVRVRRMCVRPLSFSYPILRA
jgi:hypothetical protein